MIKEAGLLKPLTYMGILSILLILITILLYPTCNYNITPNSSLSDICGMMCTDTGAPLQEIKEGHCFCGDRIKLTPCRLEYARKTIIEILLMGAFY